MDNKLIKANLSTQTLHFKPGGPAADFEVTVDNSSSQFATFQVELLAPGVEGGGGQRWYELLPEVATKKPPGDRTQFTVAIKDTPVPGFAGSMNLTVRVFSLELEEEERKVLRLVLGQGAEVPLKLELPVQRFQSVPMESLAIPLRIENPGQKTTEVRLQLSGIPGEWILGGVEQRLQLKAGGITETSFTCQVPPAAQTRCQSYPFTIQAQQPSGPPSSISGVLDVLPGGTVDFTCSQPQQQYPPAWKWRWWEPSEPAVYTLEFRNDSNVVQPAGAQVEGNDAYPYTIQVEPETIDLKPGETSQLQVQVKTRRPWAGWQRQRVLQAHAVVPDLRVNILNDTLLLNLKVLPLIPLWSQGLLTALVLYLLWWISWLNPNNPLMGHRAAVNSVEFDGLADRVVSGGDDQAVIEWQSRGFFNPLVPQQIGHLDKLDKAVRVVRFRPVNNDWIALGLENGEIQIKPLEVGGRSLLLENQKDDRVLDLVFTPDSYALFSAHGSGQVLQWAIPYSRAGGNQGERETPLRQKQFGFAVYGLGIVGDRQTLAVGGRFNQLTFWNWQQDTLRPIPYPRPGGQGDYITTLDSAAYNPYLMVTGDTQGFITLWNLRPCLERRGSCEVLDSWLEGHGGRPVRSVALSQEGCYLATGGDDGRVMLWPLTAQGKRAGEFTEGIPLQQTPTPFHAVDIRLSGQQVLVASGNRNRRVQVQRSPRLPQALCDLTQ